MKSAIRWSLALLVLLTLSTGLGTPAQGQDREPAQEQPPAPAAPGAPAPAAPVDEAPRVVPGLHAEGELRGIDSEQRFFLVVGEEGNEMLFHYDDGTEVAGGDVGVQGLAGEGGAWLSIDYRAEGENAIAESIEMSQRPVRAPAAPQGEAPEAPAPDTDF
jgi:hypothetical protein